MNKEEAMNAYVEKFGDSPACGFTELLPEEELCELLGLALESGEPLVLKPHNELEDAYCDRFGGIPYGVLSLTDAQIDVKFAQALITGREIECELPVFGDPNGPQPRF